MAHEETSADVLNSIDSTSDNPIPVIYQSGYLTIKGYDREFETYRLGFPNREVEEGFVKYLMPFYANINAVESSFEIQKFVREVRSGDYDSFFRRLQSFFADTPYELVRDLELHYQNVLFIVFKLVGFYVKAEYHTSQGRIDLVLRLINLSMSWNSSWRVRLKKPCNRSMKSIMLNLSKVMGEHFLRLE